MPGAGVDARTLDLLGNGSASGGTFQPITGLGLPSLTEEQKQQLDLKRANFNAVQNNTPYGTPYAQGGTASAWNVTQTPQGPVARPGTVVSQTQDAQGNWLNVIDANSSPKTQQQNADILKQMGAVRPNGTFIEPGLMGSEGTGVGSGANPVDPRTGMPVLDPNSRVGAALASSGQSGIPSLADQLAAARAAGQAPLGLASQVLGQTGQQASSLLAAGQRFNATAPQTAGAFGVGQRGATPGMVQLGAAPTVNGATVGMTNPGAAPGAVMPQLGTGGSGNAFQNSFLSQLQGQINAPQGPSIAAAQLRQAQADNAAQLIGAARSGRGGVGDQAEALREAMAGGSALMSDTAGQLATLRAQEEDMNKNRQLSALGLGGQLAGAQREQDLGYRAQNLGALQGDQSAGLAARGQNLQSQVANQGTQLSLEQLRGQLGLGARAQDLSALQGNQATQLGARGQDVTARAQDLSALQTDADRSLAAQQLALQGQLGLTGLGLQAQGQGLGYSQAANGLGLAGEGMAQDAINQANQRNLQMSIADLNADNALALQKRAFDQQPSFGQQLAGNVLGGVANAFGGGIVGSIFSTPASAPSIASNPATSPLYGSSAWNQIGSYS